ncbi:endonuclease III [Candidatus Pacearchaeota archaeon CG10_big_fil_rev_8_21_14_0_10_35_13]|nr:MAG: endonuclease III [Candidatus Pacearchaeota archaeon CG10_big_fil_rev_8_21_14_0_10_35_13]
MVSQKTAIKQLKALEKKANMIRLAADGWVDDWQTLIATLMSARTTDKKTIPTAELLFKKYPSLKSLNSSSVEQIASIIRQVNFHKTKAKHIKMLANILVNDYNSIIPHDFNELIKLPGVGRKTANVFLAEQGHSTIGVDTHLSYCAQRLGWTKNKDPTKIEYDLMNLFPRRLWRKLNWIVVRFGQTYTNKRIKDEILSEIKIIR